MHLSVNPLAIYRKINAFICENYALYSKNQAFICEIKTVIAKIIRLFARHCFLTTK